MIVFHEGMPGSGKSFAAMKDWVIPNIQKGRQIYARMNGLDFAKIAEVAGVEEARVRELLHEVSEEEVRAFCRVEKGEWKLPPDCLFILDELQNFFPQARSALDKETTQFIAEHRHRGMDILIMGQLLKDCHRTWVNRTNRKLQFLNKDVVGKPDKYVWKMYNGTPDAKGQVVFVFVTDGQGSYEEKYFGTYKSFKDETQNTERLTDDRANVFKSKAFRVYLPAFAVVALLALGYVVYLFAGGGLASAQRKELPKTAARPVKTVIEETGKPTVVIEEGKEDKPVVKERKLVEEEWPDYLTEILKDNRLRLAFALRSAARTKVVVEVRDKSNQIIDSFNTDQLHELGWSILVSDSLKMVSINKGDKRYLVTAWPVSEPVGKVSEPMQDQIRAESKKMVVDQSEAPKG